MKVLDRILVDPNPGVVPRMFELSSGERLSLKGMVRNIAAQFGEDFLGRRWPNRSRAEMTRFLWLGERAVGLAERGFGKDHVVDLIAATIEEARSTIGRKPNN